MGPRGMRGAHVKPEAEHVAHHMSVTLDVSKLSGWLNADVPYRVGRRACDAGQGIWSRGGRAWAGGSASAACTGNGPAVKVDGAGACAERT
eukprot:scaffold117761_cov75-Phaeocystis_antarctica.AAC.4